ncbi:hypothetical protein EDC01DRAFT_629973 [Geopyxis carbonaria]|nr:hypothetical protein EDC01DRAFT_629973 [Geopyxis carbonaria]
MGGQSYRPRRQIQRPGYGRGPAVDNAAIGNMVQQQMLQVLTSLVNNNGKRPAQGHDTSGYSTRGAPGTDSGNGPRQKHCFYCGKSDHYITHCPDKRTDEERGTLPTNWKPQALQGSSALAIMGGPSNGQETAQFVTNSIPFANTSPFNGNANARDIGPQPRMH